MYCCPISAFNWRPPGPADLELGQGAFYWQILQARKVKEKKPKTPTAPSSMQRSAPPAWRLGEAGVDPVLCRRCHGPAGPAPALHLGVNTVRYLFLLHPPPLWPTLYLLF